MSTNPGDGAHVLVFPYPAQGHMLPILDLTHQLALRGLTITILVTPNNLPILKPLLSTHPVSIQTLLLPLPSHPSIPPGVENVKDLPVGGFRAMMLAFAQLHDPILHWFRTHPQPPVAIISDMFLGWTHHLACQLGISRLVFSPSGALALSVINTLWRDRPKRDDPTNPDVPISFPKIPNCPIYTWWQLSPLYRNYVEGDPESEFIKDGFLANMASWGLVVNTSTELERVYVDHLKNELGHGRVWAVGPLIPLSGPTERGGPSSIGAEDVISWLNMCQDNSVVYVCFGSQAVLTNKQMEELAAALDLSGVRFVWIVKGATSGHVAEEYGIIPDGFEDRVVGRGLVIKGWAPQVLILRHRAVGSFLTHCGWNSVFEALVAGLPMLAWPMGADQFTDATLLVEELKVAVRVCEGAKSIPDSVELAKAIADSVSGNWSERERVMQIQKALLDSVQEGGSSFKDLDGLGIRARLRSTD